MKKINIRVWKKRDRDSSNFLDEIHLNKFMNEYAIVGTLSHDTIHCLLGQMFGRDSDEAHFHRKSNMPRALLKGCLGLPAKDENIDKVWRKYRNVSFSHGVMRR